MAFSPDGKQLALANRGVIDVWNLASHSLAFQLRGHTNFVYAVTFSPDGRWIASGGWDRAIRLWDPKTGKLERTLLGHRGFVRGLAFRYDGKQLVSCSEDRSLRLWDVATARSLATFHGHMGFVHCVAFSPDGGQAASGSVDGTIKLWPAAAPDPQVSFRNGSGWVGTVAFHPAGDRVATAHNGGIRVWNPRTGEELWRVIGPRGLMGRIGLTFTPDGKSLIASGPRRESQCLERRDRNPRPPARSFVVAHRGRRGEPGRLPPGGRLRRRNGPDLEHRHGSARPDPDRTYRRPSTPWHSPPTASLLLPPARTSTIKVWDLASGSSVLTLSGHATGVKDVAYAPDGRFLASVGGQYRGTPLAEVLIWDAKSGSLVRKLEGHTGLVTAVCYFPGGSRLATASDDRTIKLWDPQTVMISSRSAVTPAGSSAWRSAPTAASSSPAASTARPGSGARSLPTPRSRRSIAGPPSSSFSRSSSVIMLKTEVLAALKSDPTLSGPLRALATQIAERRTEDAQGTVRGGLADDRPPHGVPPS